MHNNLRLVQCFTGPLRAADGENSVEGLSKREQQDTDGLRTRLPPLSEDSAAWKEPWERARKKVGLLSEHPAGCS